MRVLDGRILTKFEDIPKIAAEIGKIKGVKAVYLFGSHARMKMHALSDIDICIIGRLNERGKLDVLKWASGNLDISFFEDLPLQIQFRVLKEGKPLAMNDSEAIRSITLAVLREYLDYTAFIENFYRRVIKNV